MNALRFLGGREKGRKKERKKERERERRRDLGRFSQVEGRRVGRKLDIGRVSEKEIRGERERGRARAS